MTVVETRLGKVRGRSAQGVTVFRGIPFARPPVGELRFEPPEPPESWTGVREARRFSRAAPQMGTEAGPVGKLFRVIRGGISEDCLYLNIWAPDLDGSKRPVLVYLHGGAYVLGAGSTFLYNGTRFASSNVVLVTFNYRLGALGFLDLSRLAADGGPPANLGIRDQIAALEWVHENIERFGGDPENVTLYGESAGAMSGGVHLALDGRRRFGRAILSSGAAANVSNPDQAEYISRRFLSELSISADDWRLVKKVPLDQVLAAQRAALQGDPARMGNLPWQPSVEHDLIRRQPLESIRSGAAADVELMIGTNREEWKLFTAGALHLRSMKPDALQSRVARLLERSGGDPDAAEELIEYHRDKVVAGRRWAYETWVAIRTEQYFLLPAIELAEAHAVHSPNTFFYRFDARAPRLPRVLGACHGIELGVVFGTFRHPFLRPIYGNRETLRRLSSEVGEAWAGFAHSGRPAWSGGPAWAAYGLDRRETMVLDDSSHVIRGPRGRTRSVWRRSATGRRGQVLNQEPP